MFRPSFLKILLVGSVIACTGGAKANEAVTGAGVTPAPSGGAAINGGVRPRQILPVSPPLDPKYYIEQQFCDRYGPAVRLANGAVFRLERTDQSCPNGRLHTPLEPANPGLQIPKTKIDFSPGSRSGRHVPHAIWETLFVPPAYANEPSAVSLAAQQTPIKTQVRNTCTYYATIAGLEAAYKRKYALTLDLSERHLNARLKMNLLAPSSPLPHAEEQSGAQDGGSVATNLTFMQNERVGVPPEQAHPELQVDESFSARDVGDDPDIEDFTLADQRKMDDFNLDDASVSIKIPAPFTLVPMPTDALLQARYRPTSIALAGQGDLSSLDWYRQQMAAGHEVVVEFKCCDGFHASPVTHNVGGTDAHAALLIGYDDNAQEFQMKNSWGENTWLRFAYDNITGGSILQAGVILDVASPQGDFSVRDNPQAFVGRWILTDAAQIGETVKALGILDIYLSPINPDSKRLGAFFAPNGSAYRVNGTVDKGTLQFFIDPSQPNLDWNAVGVGRRYTAYLFDDNRTIMAGDAITLQGGTARGFIARKDEALPTPPVATRTQAADPQRVLIGDWRLYLENAPAHLLVQRFNASAGHFEGRFIPDGGSAYNAYASTQGDGFVMWTDAPTADAFHLVIGNFADSDRKLVAGFGRGNGSAFGSSVGEPFVAVLVNEQPVITIPAVSNVLGPHAK